MQAVVLTGDSPSAAVGYFPLHPCIGITFKTLCMAAIPDEDLFDISFKRIFITPQVQFIGIEEVPSTFIQFCHAIRQFIDLLNSRCTFLMSTALTSTCLFEAIIVH